MPETKSVISDDHTSDTVPADSLSLASDDKQSRHQPLLDAPDFSSSQFNLKEFIRPTNLFPILKMRYTKDLFIADLRSAMTVTFVLIPQAVAFSSLAGVSPMVL